MTAEPIHNAGRRVAAWLIALFCVSSATVLWFAPTAFAQNSAPVAADDTYSTDEDTTLTVAAPGVLTNDTDADGDTVTAILASEPAHGTLVLNADGSFTYAPEVSFNGIDFFTYRATDGPAVSNLATATIMVNPVADVEDLVGSVLALELPLGSERSLLAKLEGALRDIDEGDTGGACARLAAFINQVRAQRGHGIAEAEADELIAGAEALRDSLGCMQTGAGFGPN